MFQLRRTAFRLLSSSPSTSFVSRPRSIVTVRSPALRLPRQSTKSIFQRRWTTAEAEAEKEEAPISKLQPTPPEEVENAINSENAAAAEASEQFDDAAAAKSSEQSEDAAAAESYEQSEDASVQSAIESATESVSDAASAVADTASRAVGGDGYRQSRSHEIGGLSGNPREPKSTVYIGNLFFDVTENDLVKELARFGTVTKCRLMRDARGLSKGFGYIDFETVASATEAVESLNQQMFEGRRLTVQYAAYETKALETQTKLRDRPHKQLNPPSKTLFIGNMSFEMTDRDLNNLFKGIRNVVDVRVAIDRRTGQPRGFAHADFVDIKSAQDALKLLEEKETYGRRLRLDFSYGPMNAPRNREGGEEGGM